MKLYALENKSILSKSRGKCSSKYYSNMCEIIQKKITIIMDNDKYIDRKILKIYADQILSYMYYEYRINVNKLDKMLPT